MPRHVKDLFERPEPQQVGTKLATRLPFPQPTLTEGNFCAVVKMEREGSTLHDADGGDAKDSVQTEEAQSA